MPAVKPAKLLNKLLAQTKLDAKRIAELEAAAASAPARIQAAVDAALAKVKADHDAALAKMKADHDEDWKHAGERQDTYLLAMAVLETKNEKLTHELGSAKHEVANLTMMKDWLETRNAELQSQLEDVKPELALMESKRAELTTLCDKVRDRMRRKEREEEQAILNRKAITGVTPGANRR